MRKTICFCFFICIGLLLAACNNNKTAATDPTETPAVTTETPTEIPTEAPTPGPTATPIPEPTLKPIEEFPLPDDPEAIGDCIKDAEVLLYVPFGDDENCAGFEAGIESGDAFDHYPQSFCVVDGKVFLLDTVNRRVIVSDNGNIKIISIPDETGFGYGQLGSICVIGETMYISPVEFFSDHIRAFDMEGTELQSISLPNTDDMIQKVSYLTEHDGCLAFMDHSLTLWVLKDGEFVETSKCSVEKILDPEMNISQDGRSIYIFTGEYTHPGLYRLMSDRAYVYVIEYVPGTFDPPIWEMSYRVYYSDGRLAGSTLVDCRNVVGYPNVPVYIANDGTLYVMCCMKDGVYITKPHLRTEYVSHLEELNNAGN